ncbi:saccharopine dehydrogenase [Kineobactrum sediminis]|uniref:Saccharopine dehydrogenase n=1 Tax=Kineobactrum sediminis TaxID=1905677 RepID=A0A2N5Y1Q6_9GAMM|nr:saccharopine dehydrogenase NADP-binding domain-containing protein [Kineobactrum sediminis]PLW82318.1 saccharopine dehydrogenase [Kineobactrum sediminis]
MATQREFDIIIWGATGFTGQLVAEYLVTNYGVGGDLRWALGGRNQSKLEHLRRHLLPDTDPEQLSLVLADSSDEASLVAMAQRTRVVCTTVGPYARYGTPLVAACANNGTHYCDLTGEVQWMARVIPIFEAAANASGARLVHTCGFDSIPSDMGTWYLQQRMIEHHGVPANAVAARVGRNRGAASGGTVASMMTTMEEARSDPAARKALTDPYSLCPAGTTGPDGPDQFGARYDSDFERWTSPFIMAAINARVVRRSHCLMGKPWGGGFRYDEALLCGSRAEALRNTLGLGGLMLGLATGPGRKLIQRFLPAPGEGPDPEQREAGYYELFFHGSHPENRDLDVRVRVAGDLDPGYGSTSRMLAEAAVCLALDPLTVAGGFWTPASAMNEHLLKRLINNASLTFEEVAIT